MFKINTTSNNHNTKSKEELQASQPKFDGKTVMGRIVKVIDYGHHTLIDYNTKQPRGEPEHRMAITVEIPSVRTEDDRPAWLTKEISVKTKSVNAAFVKLLRELCPGKVHLTDGKDNWEGFTFVNIRGFDINTDLINKPVMVGTGMTSGGWNKITSISSVPDGIEVPPLENATLVYELNIENPDRENWNRLNNWEKSQIMKDEENPEFWTSFQEEMMSFEEEEEEF